PGPVGVVPPGGAARDLRGAPARSLRSATAARSSAPPSRRTACASPCKSLLVSPRWRHPVIQPAVRQGGGGADTVVVSATTTTPPVVVWAPGAPPAGFAKRL